MNIETRQVAFLGTKLIRETGASRVDF